MNCINYIKWSKSTGTIERQLSIKNERKKSSCGGFHLPLFGPIIDDLLQSFFSYVEQGMVVNNDHSTIRASQLSREIKKLHRWQIGQQFGTMLNAILSPIAWEWKTPKAYGRKSWVGLAIFLKFLFASHFGFMRNRIWMSMAVALLTSTSQQGTVSKQHFLQHCHWMVNASSLLDLPGEAGRMDWIWIFVHPRVDIS